MTAAFRTLHVPRPLFDDMVAQALAERPLECCGLLAGEMTGGVGRVTARYPLVNATHSPTEYESDPRSILEAFRDIDRRGLEWLAVYHSHPTSAPVPSRKDLDRSELTQDVVHFIIGLAGEAPEVRGWWLSPQEGYREAAWEVVG